ncbi:site-specific integrase [Clostridium sartagoforme]|uniref:Site-specific integrase n=1 Tax=Clostridium sartagoforme TaxID=84031 RepID=A0A4S2DP10_9CLOT|nr:site-specific integrase [Clostridium sartagoforme]TGY42814.1 site-specific integrase [Clostridium sartagoforme]
MGNIVFKELEDANVLIEESIEFNYDRVDEYLTQFKKICKKGILRENSSFYDSQWIINIGGVENSIILPTDIKMKELSVLFGKNICEFELAYRSFIISSLNLPNSTMAFNLAMKRLTVQFDSSSINILVKASIVRFINYIKVSEKKYIEFQTLFDEIEVKEIGERTLPEFEEIFLFSDIINDIIYNKNILEYKDYLITIMWWKICSILPLRPSEFVRTKFECIYKEGNEFYLKVWRSKGKIGKKISNISNVNEYYFEDIVNIDEELFILIENYRDILINEFNYEIKDELFPYIILKNISNNYNNRKKNLTNISSYDLYNNVKRFYSIIVANEYGLKPISKYVKREEGSKYLGELTPYDARHIAIINLILMGTDVLEVMYLSGHTNINTAYGYFNHIREFSKGYALGYAKALSNNTLNKKMNTFINQARKQNNRGKGNDDYYRILNAINSKKVILKKVEGGYCRYQDIDNDKYYCFLYERNHTLCQFFVKDNSEVVEDEIKKVEKDIDTTVKVLIDLIKDMEGISKFNELYKTTSCRLANNISKLAKLNERSIRGE